MKKEEKTDSIKHGTIRGGQAQKSRPKSIGTAF